MARHLLFAISVSFLLQGGGVPGFLGCSGFFGVVPGAGVPSFLGLFLDFLGVPGFSGVPECFVMFRCSVFRCSWKYYMPILKTTWMMSRNIIFIRTKTTP